MINLERIKLFFIYVSFLCCLLIVKLHHQKLRFIPNLGLFLTVGNFQAAAFKDGRSCYAIGVWLGKDSFVCDYAIVLDTASPSIIWLQSRD